MSTENKNVNTSNNEGESIKPIPWEKRTMSWGSNTMLWLGGLYLNRNFGNGIRSDGDRSQFNTAVPSSAAWLNDPSSWNSYE